MTDLQTALAALKATVGTPAATSPSPTAGAPRANRRPAGHGKPPSASQHARPRPAPASQPDNPLAQGAQAAPDAAGQAAATSATPVTLVTATSPRQPPRCMPTLEKLATLYPALFGEVFLPMKRGIYQDLLAAHPEDIDKDILKEALAFHSRSTRYLVAVASGAQRHDLSGAPVEVMAPEHVHHALMEVYRRRQGRSNSAQPQTDPRGRPMEDPRAKLIKRIVGALDASGLDRAAYTELVRGKDEAANAILDEAMQQAAERAAKDEALQRAYVASGQTVQAFADAYGMNVGTVTASLKRAELVA